MEAGKAAERAGLLPGDYLVFVDRHNVVTMPEAQVLNLIKQVSSYLCEMPYKIRFFLTSLANYRTSGNQLQLETFRRLPHQVGHPLNMARGSIASHVTISEAPCSPRAAPSGRAPSARSLAEPTPARRRPQALPHLAFTREVGEGLIV